MQVLLAQSSTNLGNFEGLGPLGEIISQLSPTNVSPATSLFNRVMSIIVGFLTICAGIYFVFQFITGAIAWISAGGDEQRIKAAQGKITNAAIGLAITIAAVFLIDFIGLLLGLKILSPGGFIINIWP